MKNSIAAALAACLLVVSPAGLAGTEQDVGQAWLRASIVLDATGKLTSIEWLGTKPNDRLVTAPLEAVVRDWEFESGKLDGIPAVTRTGLLLQVTVKKTAEGGLALNIDDASTGILNVPVPPAYPVSQAKAGASAHVLLIVETDEAGRVASAAVAEYEGSSKMSSSRKDFEAAALKAVNSWTYLPEQVGGKGLRAKVKVPITFCIGSWCTQRKDRLAAAGKEVAPAGVSVALDSAAKILTRTSRVEI